MSSNTRKANKRARMLRIQKHAGRVARDRARHAARRRHLRDQQTAAEATAAALVAQSES